MMDELVLPNRLNPKILFSYSKILIDYYYENWKGNWKKHYSHNNNNLFGNNKLKHLNLSENTLTDEGIALLSDALKVV